MHPTQAALVIARHEAAHAVIAALCWGWGTFIPDTPPRPWDSVRVVNGDDLAGELVNHHSAPRVGALVALAGPVIDVGPLNRPMKPELPDVVREWAERYQRRDWREYVDCLESLGIDPVSELPVLVPIVHDLLRRHVGAIDALEDLLLERGEVTWDEAVDAVPGLLAARY